MPPSEFWPHLAQILEAAIEFREIAMREAHVKGLKVAAAYRPAGGASRSAHKWGKALDLDRIGGDGIAYYRCAVKFWSENADKFQGGMGLGLYCAPGRVGGVRVHLDIGHQTRTWQIHRGKSIRPHLIDRRKRSLARHLCRTHDLKDPLS